MAKKKGGGGSQVPLSLTASMLLMRCSSAGIQTWKKLRLLVTILVCVKTVPKKERHKQKSGYGIWSPKLRLAFRRKANSEVKFRLNSEQRYLKMKPVFIWNYYDFFFVFCFLFCFVTSSPLPVCENTQDEDDAIEQEEHSGANHSDPRYKGGRGSGSGSGHHRLRVVCKKKIKQIFLRFPVQH